MKSALLTLLVFCLLSCADGLKKFDTFPENNVLKLVATKTTASANGFDEVILTATIAKETDADKREITFTTTSGTFSDSQTKETRVQADAQGIARAILKAPLAEGTASVTAKAGTFAVRETITFQPADPSTIIQITGPAEKEADGVSRADFTIIVPSALLQQTVSVSTTMGVIINSGATAYSSKPEKDSQGGKVSFSLRSPVLPGIGFIKVSVGGYERSQEIKFSAVSADKILKLEGPGEAEADGTGIVTLTVRVPANSEISQNNITVTTTGGTLLSTSPARPGADGSAPIQLRAPTEPMTAYVTAELLSVRQTKTIRFDRAYPDRIVVDPGAFELKARNNESLLIEAKLLRNSGIPTRDTEVEFEVYDEADRVKLSNVGQFRAVSRSNANGVASAQFTAGSVNFRGRITIRATVNRPNPLSPVVGRAPLQIVDP